LTDMDHLTGIKPGEYKFKWYKQTDYLPMTEENFRQIVPVTPKKYMESVDHLEQVQTESKKISDDLHRIKKLSGLI